MILTDTEKTLWNKAIQYLSKREYSREELTAKLCSKGEECGNVLDALEENGYLSNRRFTESFIRMRIAQGHGLNRIRFDLKRKGIQSELMCAVLEELEVDWYALAGELYQRKYRSALEERDFKERNKRIRFMSQRGFLMDEIQEAMAHSSSSEIE